MSMKAKDHSLDISLTVQAQVEVICLAFPALLPEARIMEVPR